MKKAVFSLALALTLLISLAPAALARGGDGDIRWFEHGLPGGLTQELLDHPGGYSPVYLPESDLFVAAPDTGSADYFPLVDLKTGRDMGYQNVFPVGNILAYTDAEGDYYGLLTADGQLLRQTYYEDVYYDEEYDCIICETPSGDEEYFSADGKSLLVLPDRLPGLYPFYDSKESAWGFEDEKGNAVIQAIYEYVSDCVHGVCPAKENGKWALLDTSGKPLTDAKYNNLYIVEYPESIEPHPEKAPIPAAIDGKWGVLGRDGKEYSDFIYDDMGPFTEGLAAVELNGKWGFVDTEGKVVIEPTIEAESVGFFCGGIAAVEVDYDYSYLIDKKGQALVPKDKYYISQYDVLFGLAIAETEDGTVLLNARGQEVFSHPYEYMTFINYDCPDYGRWILISDGERFGIYENPNFPAKDKKVSFLWWAIPLIVVLAGLITAAVVLVSNKKRVPPSAAAEPATYAPTASGPSAAGGAPALNFCPECGAKLSPENKFCPNCGHKL